MRLAAWPDSARPVQDIRKIAEQCEAQGWDVLYIADHFMPDGSAGTDDGPILEYFSTLAA